MNAHAIHTCSYQCERPECIRAQRDELAAKQGFTAADMADQAASAFERGRESVLADRAAAAQEAVAYLDIGAGGYLDLGSDLPEQQLLALPKGRHALGIIGTFGIDGYVAASAPAAPGIDLQWLVEGLDEIGSLSCNLRQGGCDAGDLEGLENGLMHAVDMAHQLRDRLLAMIDASPKVGSEARALLGALVSLVAVARRYLPDYDEHPEIQKADDAIDAAMQAQARDGFEAWATSQQLPIKRHRWGEYKVDDTEAAWEAWQAALRAAP